MTLLGKLAWAAAALTAAIAAGVGLAMLAFTEALGGDGFWRAIAALSFATVAGPLLWMWRQRLFPDRWPR